MNRRDGGDGGRDLKRPRHGYDPIVEDSRRNTPRWRRMTAQVMANIVWAYATANNDPGPELFEVLGAAAMGCLGT